MSEQIFETNTELEGIRNHPVSFEHTTKCLINPDLCRQIASYCNCRDLLSLEMMSKHWQEIVMIQYHEIRHHIDNAHLIFKFHKIYDTDKKMCNRLYNNRIHNKSEVYMFNGALHANCKTTYMFLDSTNIDNQLYGGHYADAPTHIVAAAATTDVAGNMLLLGGWDHVQEVVCPFVMKFDLSNHFLATTQLPDLPQALCFSAAERNIQGDILVIGGGNSPFSAATSYNSVMIYKYHGVSDWQQDVVPNMHQIRCGHRAVTLFNDSILVAGGYAGKTTFLNSVELLDKNLDQWITLPSMHSARSGAASVLGQGGEMYMCGGTMNTNDGLNSIERYDHREGKWTLLANMQQKRSFVVGCQSVNGGFYVLGGMHEGIVHTSIEYYDYRMNKWSYAMGNEENICYELSRVSAYMTLKL